MKAIIMAGGEGSRLRPLTCDCPKPMMRLKNRPIMQYAVELLAAHGVTEIAAVGGFTHSNKTLLICVVNKHQIVQFQRIIQQFPGSFAYLSTVKETMGTFRKIK